MINFIACDRYEGRLSNPDSVFNVSLSEPEWFSDPIVKKICKDIDGAEVIMDFALRSRWGYAMSPLMLSTGAKTLILLYKRGNLIIKSSKLGDNCYDFINDVAKEYNNTIIIKSLFPIYRLDPSIVMLEGKCIDNIDMAEDYMWDCYRRVVGDD